MINDGGDPLLVAAEAYFRKDTATLTEGLISEVLDFIEGNLAAGSTWMGVYGMKIYSGEALTELLPVDVLKADGTDSAVQPPPNGYNACQSHAKPWLFSLIPFEHHQATARLKHHSITLRLQPGYRQVAVIVSSLP